MTSRFLVIGAAVVILAAAAYYILLPAGTPPAPVAGDTSQPAQSAPPKAQ